MSSAFLPIIIVVAVVGIGVSLTALAWPFAVMEEIGRTGDWFHHSDMDPPEAQPDGNQNDPTIPFKPLRGRD
jgi:hypothetical protein